MLTVVDEMRTYPTGVPCWVDTEQPDTAAAAQFYGALFGWTFEEAMPPGAPGSYLIAQLGGRDVGAIAPSSESAAVWNTYICVDDADRCAQRVAELGGRVMSPPADAGPGGRGATFVDPFGAAFRVWQPRRRLGAQVVNVDGAWNFSDLHTADPSAAATFYAAVFGWELDELEFGDAEPARMWRRPGYGDHLAATVDPDIHERQQGVSAPPGFADAIAWLAPLYPGESAHWHVTFAVGDRDDTVAKAVELGATDVSGPIDTMWTKETMIRDPQGGLLTVSQFTPPTN